jgi:transposase
MGSGLSARRTERTASTQTASGYSIDLAGLGGSQTQTTLYLYGVVEPATGEHFFYEFTHCNTDCFELFLNLVAEEYPDSILIIRLDQAGWHKAKRLQVPDNIILMVQPAHSPECNPIEQVWQYLKKRLRWTRPKTLDDLRQLIREQLLALSTDTIASITGRASILEALSVAGI